MTATGGIYDDMSNADYHAETDWLSASQLKTYLPELYTKPTGRDALDFGTAFHTRTLGTGEVIDVHEFPTWLSKAAKEARAASDASGAIPILADDNDRIDAMVEAVNNHRLGSLLLNEPGRPEVSIFATDNDGTKLKCRPDRLTDDGIIIDLKSTSGRPGRNNLTRAVIDYGYDLQAAHYLATAELAGIQAAAFVFVFVAKQAPHFVTVVDLSPELLERGHALRNLALSRIADGTPVYEGASEALTLDCPRWAKEIPA